MSSYGELAIHRWMLRDSVRNEAFDRALRKVVKPGDVVLDVGAGTGFLSILAAAAGARRVYAVEQTSIATEARQMVERNGYRDTIEVIEMPIEDATLPEKVDVIVSEWMGGFGVDENILSSLVIARDRWLKPGGTIVPGRITALLAPAAIPDFDESLAYWRTKPHGVPAELAFDRRQEARTLGVGDVVLCPVGRHVAQLGLVERARKDDHRRRAALLAPGRIRVDVRQIGDPASVHDEIRRADRDRSARFVVRRRAGDLRLIALELGRDDVALFAPRDDEDPRQFRHRSDRTRGR
jgi:SAM-dependent methyltransferase